MPHLSSFGRSGLSCFSRPDRRSSSLRFCVRALRAAARRWPGGRLSVEGPLLRPGFAWLCPDGCVGVHVQFRPTWDGSGGFRFRDRVAGFYYDPFFWGLDGRPFVSPWPRFLPRTRCFLMAVWFAVLES